MFFAFDAEQNLRFSTQSPEPSNWDFIQRTLTTARCPIKILRVGNTGGLLPSFIAGAQDKLIGAIQLLAGFRTDP